VRFAESIRLLHPNDRYNKKLRSNVHANWYLLPSGSPLKMMCSSIWKFRIKGSDYVIELTSFRNHISHKEKVLDDMWTAYQSRWSVGLYRPQWDLYLDLNRRMGLGEKASWTPQEHAFFPPNPKVFRDSKAAEDGFHYKGDGFLEFIQKLQMTEAIARGETLASCGQSPKAEQPLIRKRTGPNPGIASKTGSASSPENPTASKVMPSSKTSPPQQGHISANAHYKPAHANGSEHNNKMPKNKNKNKRH